MLTSLNGNRILIQFLLAASTRAAAQLGKASAFQRNQSLMRPPN